MESSGLVKGIVTGIGGLIIATIIVLTIVSTLIEADFFTRGTNTVINETPAFINNTGYALTEFGLAGREDFEVVGVVNSTSNTNIVLANLTLDTSTGIITNATPLTFGNVSINYTYTDEGDDGYTSRSMSGNLTEGINNISEKIPTILLIAAVVILFGVIVFLVSASKRMGVGSRGGI